jgi:hypothetical protein
MERDEPTSYNACGGFMSIIRAHYDGKVFVPEGPVDCPPGVPVTIHWYTDQPKQNPLSQLAEIAAESPADPEWPKDFSAQVDHYLYGTPKRDEP